MFRYVVPDSCALGAAYFSETFSDNAAPLLEAIRLGTVDALAPSVCISEFLNVCRKKLAEGISPADVDRTVANFLHLPIVWIEMEPVQADRSWRLFRDS